MGIEELSDAIQKEKTLLILFNVRRLIPDPLKDWLNKSYEKWRFSQTTGVIVTVSAGGRIEAFSLPQDTSTITRLTEILRIDWHGESITTLQQDWVKVLEIAFDSEGNLFTVDNRDFIIEWDPLTGKKGSYFTELPSISGWITSMAISQETQRTIVIVGMSSGAVIALWNYPRWLTDGYQGFWQKAQRYHIITPPTSNEVSIERLVLKNRMLTVKNAQGVERYRIIQPYPEGQYYYRFEELLPHNDMSASVQIAL